MGTKPKETAKSTTREDKADPLPINSGATQFHRGLAAWALKNLRLRTETGYFTDEDGKTDPREKTILFLEVRDDGDWETVDTVEL